MVRTLNLTADVQPDQPLAIDMPSDMPAGLADVVVVIAPRSESGRRTLGELLRSGMVGIWKDRTDIQDSAVYARALRQNAWTRDT